MKRKMIAACLASIMLITACSKDETKATPSTPKTTDTTTTEERITSERVLDEITTQAPAETTLVIDFGDEELNKQEIFQKMVAGFEEELSKAVSQIKTFDIQIDLKYFKTPVLESENKRIKHTINVSEIEATDWTCCALFDNYQKGQENVLVKSAVFCVQLHVKGTDEEGNAVDDTYYSYARSVINADYLEGLCQYNFDVLNKCLSVEVYETEDAMNNRDATQLQRQEGVFDEGTGLTIKEYRPAFWGPLIDTDRKLLWCIPFMENPWHKLLIVPSPENHKYHQEVKKQEESYFESVRESYEAEQGG